jgi:hypothetical protein
LIGPKSEREVCDQFARFVPKLNEKSVPRREGQIGGIWIHKGELPDCLGSAWLVRSLRNVFKSQPRGLRLLHGEIKE